MKRLVIYLFLLFPFLSFGQLLPKLPEFNGNIAKIVEKKYGKELKDANLPKNYFRAKSFSGWKYSYYFDQNSRLTKRTNTFNRKLKAEYIYQHERSGNRIIERELIADPASPQNGNYMEYENFTDSLGRISMVNHWTYSAREGKRELVEIENNAEYKNNVLSSFTRYLINTDGEKSDGEKCSLFYDSHGNLIRTERKDLSSGFSSVISYEYDSRNFLIQYSIDFLTEIQEFQRNQVQEIAFQCDQKGNWTKMFWKTAAGKRLIARRKISYR